MNYVGRIQLSESYLEPFFQKIGLTVLRNNSEKTVLKPRYMFFKTIKVVLNSEIIVLTYIPVNHNFRRKQSNHKTDQSMKTDQSVRLFSQMPRLIMPKKLNICSWSVKIEWSYICYAWSDLISCSSR